LIEHKLDKETLKALLDEETWLSATVKFGLCDVVEDANQAVIN
jgi:predicted metal-dependent TIM-barrel fold hydrolase